MPTPGCGAEPATAARVSWWGPGPLASAGVVCLPPDHRTVVLVCGPPCAGKTSYVKAHAQPGDLILDQDELGHQGMRAALDHVTRMRSGTAWVIRCSPGPARREHLARRIRATDTVLLVPPCDVLRGRARNRPGARRTLAGIKHWQRVEQADSPPALPSTRKPKGSTAARGYGYGHERLRKALLPSAYGQPCHHCGQTMLRSQALDLDHTPDRSGYRGMAHASCNRRDGARSKPRQAARGTSRSW